MKRTSLLAALALGLVASPALAGKKKKKAMPEAKVPAAAAAPTTPDDGASKKFGMQLMTSTLRNFRPSDGGAKFQYDAMTFAADNTWKADGWVEFDDERMECAESGKWSMDPAESDKVATVTWTVDDTDCPGREAGAEVRAQLTLGKGGAVEAVFR